MHLLNNTFLDNSKKHFPFESQTKCYCQNGAEYTWNVNKGQKYNHEEKECYVAITKKRKKKERGLISDLTCTVYSTSLNQDCPMGIVTAFPHFNYKENTDEEI